MHEIVPTEDIKITSLGKTSKLNDKEVTSVKMLGSNEKLVWNLQADAPVITKPSLMPEWEVVSFAIEFKK